MGCHFGMTLAGAEVAVNASTPRTPSDTKARVCCAVACPVCAAQRTSPQHETLQRFFGHVCCSGPPKDAFFCRGRETKPVIFLFEFDPWPHARFWHSEAVHHISTRIQVNSQLPAAAPDGLRVRRDLRRDQLPQPLRERARRGVEGADQIAARRRRALGRLIQFVDR